MDIHRLEVFCKVLELQSFTRAADAVCLTQPTVSEHIRALEETVGEKLVDRLGREVLPTPAGKILYRYARDMILLRDEAIQALEKFKGKLSGHLLIGASTIPGTYILPQLIGSFKASHPTIQITLKIGSSGEIVQGLLDGKLELGPSAPGGTTGRSFWRRSFPMNWCWPSIRNIPWRGKRGEPGRDCR